MRIVKPLKLSLLFKPYEHMGRHWLAVGVLLMWDLRSGSVRPENEFWKTVARAIGRGALFDAAMPKVRGEYLAFGSFHAPGGTPAEAGYVRIVLGELDKRLNVYGDRYWGAMVPSRPEPMTVVPITWAQAFGGEGYAANPLGKGVRKIATEGGKVWPLPNVEDPAKLIGAPGDKPSPGGFGSLDSLWPQRFEKVGTYDEKWVRERAPGLADDIDLEYFNAAPQDQWLEDFWVGDEAYEIRHMHPNVEAISGRLPRCKGRCFIQQTAGDERQFRELETHLDTVIFFPEQLAGIQIWRGVTEIATDDAADVSVILAAYEKLGQTPRPVEHYATALANRLDKDKRLKYLLDESDLIPDGDTSGLQEIIDSAKKRNERESLMKQNMENKAKQVRADAEKQLQAQREELQKTGLDPDQYLPAALPEPEAPPALDVDMKDPAKTMEQASSLMDEMKKKAEQAKQEAEDKAREMCKQAGVDYDKLVAESRQKAALPRVETKGQLEQLKTAMTISPETKERLQAELGEDPIGVLEQRFAEAEKQFRKGYRMAAEKAVGDALPDERAAKLPALREEVLATLHDGGSLVGRDLAGLSLAGESLLGADFSDCFLEFADFSGANLTGAHFTGAILAKASFQGATLEKADFTNANVGKVDFTDAKAAGINLKDAVLAEADFTRADLSGLKLESGQFMNVNWTEACLDNGCIGSGIFYECCFAGARFQAAQIGKATVFKANMAGLDLSRATLMGTLFVEADLRGLRAPGVTMESVRFIKDVNLEGADFTGAQASKCNFRDCNLKGAKFTQGRFDASDFSGANLEDADFSASRGHRLRCMKANLEGANCAGADFMEATLNKARLVRVNFRGASLYGAEFAGAVLGDTDFRDANLKRTKLKDWQP